MGSHKYLKGLLSGLVLSMSSIGLAAPGGGGVPSSAPACSGVASGESVCAYGDPVNCYQVVCGNSNAEKTIGTRSDSAPFMNMGSLGAIPPMTLPDPIRVERITSSGQVYDPISGTTRSGFTVPIGLLGVELLGASPVGSMAMPFSGMGLPMTVDPSWYSSPLFTTPDASGNPTLVDDFHANLVYDPYGAKWYYFDALTGLMTDLTLPVGASPAYYWDRELDAVTLGGTPTYIGRFDSRPYVCPITPSAPGCSGFVVTAGNLALNPCWGPVGMIPSEIVDPYNNILAINPTITIPAGPAVCIATANILGAVASPLGNLFPASPWVAPPPPPGPPAPAPVPAPAPAPAPVPAPAPAPVPAPAPAPAPGPAPVSGSIPAVPAPVASQGDPPLLLPVDDANRARPTATPIGGS